jgi:hypothetical protein
MLSKSSFIKGLQCHKQLYLYKNHPELMDKIDAGQQAIFDTGHNVGELATQLFPGGKMIPHQEIGFPQQLALTKVWIDSGVTTIYEAAFAAGGVFARVDILHLGKDGWELYEVKSSTKVHEVYKNDIAVQYHTLTKAGLNIHKARLITLDSHYRRQGDLEVAKLFAIHDLTETVRERQPFVAYSIKEMETILAAETEPNVEIGPHCSSPHRCSFFKTCHKGIPKNSVFNLADIHTKKAYALYHSGFVTYEQIPLAEVNRNQQLQIRCYLDQTNHIEPNKIRAFTDKLRYPLCFIDFETTYLVAIPIFNGTGPYQQTPFQYSMHLQREAGGALEHVEFIADPKEDPPEVFLESLRAHIPKGACLIAYNMKFEKGRLTELARLFPGYAADIAVWQHNMLDLMELFQKRDIYYWQQNGSYSIKHVLPALIPEMGYDGLTIANGGDAAAAYLRMRASSDSEEIALLREQLLAYCKLDTLAMVRLLEKLQDLAAL